MSVRAERSSASWAMRGVAAIAAAFLALPLIALAVKAPWAHVISLVSEPESRSALWLSLVCSVSAAAVSVLTGVPLGWLLARGRFSGRNILRAIAIAPIVLPPVVGGVGLLLAFGRRGLLGPWLERLFGVSIPFTIWGAILAEAFIAMPFVVISAEAGIRNVDRRFEEAAASLGAGEWTVMRRVTLRMSAPAIASGALLAWARALGEFGATLTFNGSLPGRTETMPLAVFKLLEVNPDAAIALSLVLVAISFATLVLMRGRWLPALARGADR